MKNILKLTRPYQWVKNAFIFMPVFFGGAITDPTALWHTLIAFFAYSFTASAIYCFNDINDVEDDRRHSEKCKRPIASGAISIGMGYGIMGTMLLLAGAAISLMGENWMPMAIVVAGYFVMDLLYCKLLKHYAIVDVCVIAFGFVLRILAGSAASGVIASQWLVLMTFLLTLLLSFAKRRDDVLRMQRTGEAPRHNTHRYNIDFINQAITVIASVTLVCYVMYTMSADVTNRTNFQYVYLTSIFVVLGLLRYMQRTLVDNKSGDPTKLLYEDRFIQMVIAMWGLSYLTIIYIM